MNRASSLIAPTSLSAPEPVPCQPRASKTIARAGSAAAAALCHPRPSTPVAVAHRRQGIPASDRGPPGTCGAPRPGRREFPPRDPPAWSDEPASRPVQAAAVSRLVQERLETDAHAFHGGQRAANGAHTLWRHFVLTAWPRGARRIERCDLRADQALGFEPFQRDVDRPARHLPPRPALDLVADRRRVGLAIEVHHGEQDERFEFAEDVGHDANIVGSVVRSVNNVGIGGRFDEKISPRLACPA